MRKLREILLKIALIAAAVITGGILLFLIGIIVKRGLPQLSWSFLTTATSYLAGTTGILPNICNTLYLILIAMGVALPLGVGAAVYITEYAENPRVVRLISFAADERGDLRARAAASAAAERVHILPGKTRLEPPVHDADAARHAVAPVKSLLALLQRLQIARVRQLHEKTGLDGDDRRSRLERRQHRRTHIQIFACHRDCLLHIQAPLV